MDADSRVKTRLSGMMVLVYSVQGAFWPLLSIHLLDLGISERGRGWIFATMALASFAMPLGAGQLVDRLMPTQRFLSLTFGAGTGILALMAWGVTAHVGGCRTRVVILESYPAFLYFFAFAGSEVLV